MIKPHTILLLSALLAVCAAVFFTIANHEPKAALAAGYALLAGLISLALYLSDRQGESYEDKEAKPVQPDVSAKREAEPPASAGSEGNTKRSASPITVSARGAKTGRQPNYTSHSRA